MFAECLSLSDSQYVILLLLLIFQLSVYRTHPYFIYSIAITLGLLAVYPVFFDTLPREIFALLFSLVLLAYTVQLVYVSLSVRELIPAAVVVGVYMILFFVATTVINTALLFTRPVDAVVGLYDQGQQLASLVERKESGSSPYQTSVAVSEPGRGSAVTPSL
jgi:hypothetical protein